MTVKVELPPEIEERFIAEARDRRMPLDAYLRECLSSFVQSRLLPKLSPEAVDRRLDEAADLVPTGPTLSDFAMSRESIYTREDEW